MNYVLVQADKAAYNAVAVRRLYYINTLKRELVDSNAYKLQPSLSERGLLMGMVVIQPYILVSELKKIKTKFLRCTGYLISIKDPIKQYLLLFCYESDFMVSLSDDKQAGVIDAFNTTSRYLDNILNINNVYFDNMVSQMYPSKLQLNKANTSDTEATFLDLHLSISNDIVSTKNL